MKVSLKKRWFIILLILVLALIWIATTDNAWIWPVRNTLQYQALVWWQGSLAQPVTGDAGTLQGTVSDSQGNPVAGAGVLIALREGDTYSTRSDADGKYIIDDIPPGTYRPVAGAPGYENVQFGGIFGRVAIEHGTTTEADVTLPIETPRMVTPGRDLQLGESEIRTCTRPFESQATRRQIHFISDDQPNQPSFYYTPLTATVSSQLPTLLAIYPGPAGSWDCASLPLAAAGYAVIATGPAYSFDPEADVDEQERVLSFIREGALPGNNGQTLAILGGSYSSLHVQRLLQRGQDVDAALLLGPPTDLFDMRRRLENGSYVPPFGLDQALIAMGLPDQNPLHYWPYSGAYHVRSDFPPLAILHSRTDEVVPYQQSELLVANLDEVGAPYEVYFFDGASHYLLAEGADADTLKIYKITLDFLSKHLQ